MGPSGAGHRCAWPGQHHRCVGCEEPRPPPGGPGTAIARHERRGNRRRRARLVGAAAARERTGVRTEPQAAVRSTLPEAEAMVPARVRAAERNAVPRLVRGEARTGEARSAARAEPRRGPRRARRAASARGDHGGRAGDAVEPCRHGVGPARGGERSELAGKRSAQRPKGAEARGIAAEIGAKRRLQRKARSRSDAPIFIACIGEPVSIIGTIGICTTTIIDTDTGITGHRRHHRVHRQHRNHGHRHHHHAMDTGSHRDRPRRLPRRPAHVRACLRSRVDGGIHRFGGVGHGVELGAGR